MSVKTTVYLPESLKEAVERQARVEGCSEAEVIRRAITDQVARRRPRRGGFIRGEPISHRVDELLEGFGEH